MLQSKCKWECFLLYVLQMGVMLGGGGGLGGESEKAKRAKSRVCVTTFWRLRAFAGDGEEGCR